MIEGDTILGSEKGEPSNDSDAGSTHIQSNGDDIAQSHSPNIEGTTNGHKQEFRNDLLDLAPNPNSVDFKEIARLSEYKFERVQALDWAMYDMKYLIYDDTDIKTNGYDSDDDSSQRMPHDPEYDDEKDLVASSSKQVDAESPCFVCQTYPEFPHSWKPRKFRIVKPTLDHPGQPVDTCLHYVAVSYCWPPQDEKSAPPSYQVRDLNGEVRRSRALDDVLDRAVDFANTFGLRMIWIDQECLPQPTEESSPADRSEQELGIQAMDIVYNRALVTAGMLDVIIHTQAQLDALSKLMFLDKAGRRTPIDDELCYFILDVLHRTTLDRWYTRAWVIQESLCAGEKLVLTFRRGNGLSFPSRFQCTDDKHEKMSQSRHSLNDKSRQLTSNIVCVPLKQFWSIIDTLRCSLDRDFVHLGPWLVNSTSTQPQNLPRLQAIIAAADSLHPRFAKGDTLSTIIRIQAPGIYGRRPTIDAAGALTLLKYRQCRYDYDRLAIIANMCDYDFRLNTQAVEQNCSSLRQAILALALNNGDVSLLVPEIYLSGKGGSPNTNETGRFSDSCLFTEVLNDVVHIEHCKVRNAMSFRLQTSRPGWVISEGLQFSAYVWSVSAFANFQPIQEMWADTWDSLKCWRIAIERIKGETPEQRNAREVAITHRFSQPWAIELVSLEYKFAGHISSDSVIWRGIDNTGVHVSRFLDPRRAMHSPAMRDILTRIIFDILRHATMSLSDTRHAQGLANSLWHSVRADGVSAIELPDAVGEALFSHKDVLAQPWATLQLDLDPATGTFAQLWFVDRIMEQGGLWCGHYTKSRRFPNLRLEPESPPGSSDSASSSLVRCVDDEKGKSLETNQLDMSKRSILEKQLRMQILANMWAAADLTKTREPDKKRMWGLRNPAAGYAYICAYPDYHNAKGEERRSQNLVSAFDVEGPCLIATPYNADWEMLPRPELRSMSVCWVIDPLLIKPRSEEDKILFKRWADNVWGRKSKGKAPQGTIEEDNLEETTKSKREGDEEDLIPAYRVLRKVKGVWQIMDLPSQEYVFS
jgi:hypothetical protein